MSDTYNADEPETSFDPANFLLNEQRSAKASALGALQDDPEKAARAAELSEATGDHPALVYGNLENYEQQHKASLTAQLLSNNKFLSEYVNSHPLADKISNDDYGQLDAVSSQVQKLNLMNPTGVGGRGVYEGTGSVMSEASKAFKETWEGAQLGSESEKLAQMMAESPFWGNLFIRHAAHSAAVVGAGSMHLFSAGISGAMAGIGETYKQLGGLGIPKVAGSVYGSIPLTYNPDSLIPVSLTSPNPKGGVEEAQSRMTPQALTRDLIVGAQVAMSGQAGLHGSVSPALHAEIAKFTGVIKPYLDAGVEPPVGVHPLIDQVKVEQSKMDLGNLDDAFKEAQASRTKERNPEIFANFIRQHTDAQIGISAEAVRAMYGDKSPIPGDGKLGDFPRVAEQLATAEASGGDVQIPLADWLAKADPKVASELHDSIRVRPGGLTVEEAKEIKVPKAEEAPVEGEAQPLPPSPVDSVRQSSALQPLFQADARKVELRHEGEPFEGTHSFALHDAQGEELGGLTISEEKGGKRLYVDDIDSKQGPGAMGPAAMRDVLRQIQEQFPNAETISGMRVSGAREKAGAPPKMEIPLRDSAKVTDADLITRFQELGWEEEYGFGNKAIVLPKELYTEHENAIVSAVNSELARIIPKQAEVAEAHALRGPAGDSKQGLHLMFKDRQPLILWSLESGDPLGTGRHEALHHLRQQGFFSKDEWATLTYEAAVGDWIKKHNINSRYGDLSSRAKLEEAIAEEYATWRRGDKGFIRKAIDKVVGEPKADAIFRKLRDLLDGIKEKIKDIVGFEPTAEDLFNKADRGEIGSREGNKPLLAEAYKEQREPELPQSGTTRLEDRETFAKASAIGMTVEQYKRYMALIDRRGKEDLEAATKSAEEEQRKRQTKEWKSNAVYVRKEVSEEINSRPDVAADTLLRSGRLYGEELSSKPKLDPTGLDDAQRRDLPKEYLAGNGLHPDDLARLFGYSSGKALVDRLVQLNKEREASGMKPDAFRERMIEAETDRRMVQKYGDLERNILDEAKDQALSETQIDLLHEETMALATKAGAELSITKEGLKAWVKDEFDKTPIKDISTDKFLASAGKAGRAAEEGLLANKPTDAFKAKQQQYIAITMANAAKKIEKEQASFAKTAKRLSAREVPSIDQEYTNFIHDIFLRIGQPVKRSVQDLQESIARGEQKSLADFVDFKEGHDMREVPVAEFLLDPAFRKDTKDLTVQEFQAMHDSVKTLIKNGRDEKKINKVGEEADLAVVKEQMISQITEFKEKHYDASGNRWLGIIPPALARPLRTYLVSHLQLESIFNRWDRGDPHGVFTQYIARELATAANGEAALERKYSRVLAGIADKADLRAGVENPLFKDPLSSSGTLIQMNRKNLRAVLLNAGNKSNLDKLARGYKVSPEAVMQWLHNTATKEDWDWAQKVGDAFKDIKAEADTMYRGLTGIEPESIPIDKVDTPHGKYDGWYYPIIYHPVWEGASKKLMGGDALEQDNYIRATTPRGYTKARTGYAAPMALDMDMMPVRMRQMLHDIAMRPAVINASKIFYDKDVRTAITKHYGKEYKDLLVPYLRDVANSANYRSDAQKVGVQVSEFIRQNVISTLIGLNPGTVLKHGPTAAINSLTEVGPLNFLKAVKGLTSINDATGETNWTFAMKTSEELQRRHRHYQETLGGAQEKVMGEASLRDSVIAFSAYPVAISDLLSATPTWMAQYEKTMGEGATHGDAVFMADRAVRRAHGSSVITNRSGIMRGGALMSWMTSVYGFFNHIMNRQYELMWKAGDTLDLVKQGEYKEAMAKTPELTGMLFSYVILPAMIEEMVTPLASDQNESWGKKAAKGLAYTVSASWIGIRDIASAILRGTDPSIGLMSTTYKTITDLSRDFTGKQPPLSKQKAGAIIQHGTTAFGALTGLTNAQMGKSGRYIYNYATGQEHPKGPWGAMVGMRFGQSKGHSQSFDEWQRKH